MYLRFEINSAQRQVRYPRPAPAVPLRAIRHPRTTPTRSSTMSLLSKPTISLDRADVLLQTLPFLPLDLPLLEAHMVLEGGLTPVEGGANVAAICACGRCLQGVKAPKCVRSSASSRSC